MPIKLVEQAAPTAASGYGSVYVDTSNRLAYQDEAGVTGLVGIKKALSKSAETQVSNASTTLANDDTLLFAIGASETWVAEFVLFVSTNVAAGIKGAITVPASGVLRLGADIYTTTTINALDTTTSSGTAIGATAACTRVHCHVRVANSTNAGNVTLQWAQNASNASDTKVLIGSYVEAMRQL